MGVEGVKVILLVFCFEEAGEEVAGYDLGLWGGGCWLSCGSWGRWCGGELRTRASVYVSSSSTFGGRLMRFVGGGGGMSSMSAFRMRV